MNLGTPRMLMHAARLRHNPELDHHELSPEHDPVERTVIVDEPAVPDHVGDLAGEPTAPRPDGEDADGLVVPGDGPAVPDDISELFEGFGSDYLMD